MPTARRKRTQGGQEIFDFALVSIFLYVPMFLGMFVVGMNLIRSIQANQVVRDLDDMYIHGGDFSTYGLQAEAQRLAQGLNVQIGSSFAGNEATNTSNSGNGIITVSQIMYIGPTTGANCQSAAPATCANANSFVFTQQIQFGNGTLSSSSTVSLGSPTGSTQTTDGTVLNYITDIHTALPSSAQASMQALWQTTSNGQAPLTDGQVAYVVEGYFQSPDLSISSLAGGGVYARYFF